MNGQVHYAYWDLEEHSAGMWRQVPVSDRDRYTHEAANLMRDPERFKYAMLRAVEEWPKSCEASMTTPSLNQRA